MAQFDEHELLRLLRPAEAGWNDDPFDLGSPGSTVAFARSRARRAWSAAGSWTWQTWDVDVR